MSKGKGREFMIGNTKIIIHSPLMDMTEDEREAWFKSEMKKGNPVLKQIAKAVNDCYRKYD
ncbi:hypothetical protein CVN76_01585 [Bacillus sp. mrc49]|nr:hypothetical protein CVN76_05255 [Bacillus sp. mrc49]PJN92037.1 hypothetical protein CVN76_01585 [Bacillus sp. mrc49]